MAEAPSELQESSPLAPGQEVQAVQAFVGEQYGDLAFACGELLTIVEKSDLLYWYIAKNRNGVEGLVPRNFVEPLQPRKGGAAVSFQPKAKEPGKPGSTAQPLSEEEMRFMRILQFEKEQRHKAGTLVTGRTAYAGEQPGDLPFGLGEELQILRPLEDLGWYYAKKLDKSGASGAIPITHVGLVYDSEDDEENVYNKLSQAAHDRIYDDMNDFISLSGWFSHPPYALGKEALHHKLAKKCFMEYSTFKAVKEAVYVFQFKGEEKTFVGKATVLHLELEKHFSCFGKDRKDIREIDDELCHHTQECHWTLKVFVVGPSDNLEVEWAKKVITFRSLITAKDPGGLNETLSFSQWENWAAFAKWFFPASSLENSVDTCAT